MKRFFCWLFTIHCCDFGKWEIEVLRFTRPVKMSDGNLYLTGETTYEYSMTIQKRKCKGCGFTQFESVDY